MTKKFRSNEFTEYTGLIAALKDPPQTSRVPLLEKPLLATEVIKEEWGYRITFTSFRHRDGEYARPAEPDSVPHLRQVVELVCLYMQFRYDEEELEKAHLIFQVLLEGMLKFNWKDFPKDAERAEIYRMALAVLPADANDKRRFLEHLSSKQVVSPE